MHTSKAVRTGVQLVLAVVPVWLTCSVLTTPGVPMPLRILVLATALVAWIRPAEAVVAAVMVAPLGALIASAFEFPPFRFAEAIVMAWLAGWLLRRDRDRQLGPSPARALRVAAWAVGALVLVSVAVQARQFRFNFPTAWHDAIDLLRQAYYVTADPIGVGSALLVLEGLAIAAAVVLLIRQWPVLAVRVPDALAVACGVAAVAAALLWGGIGFADVLERQARLGFRVAAHVEDVNAAGSYFVLMLGLAGGMAARERGRRRAWWAATAVSAAFGLWMSGSRSAQIAAFIVLPPACGWALTRTWPNRVRYGALVLLIVAGVALSAVRAIRLEADPTYHGAGFRADFTRTSARMIAARPWFGVGIGQYYPRSPLFLSPQLAWTYGQENAHNYFLQFAAELGLVGFAAAAVLVAGAIGCGGAAVARSPGDHRLLGLFAGVVAFLVTCVTGHPLLVPEVAYPFWISAGLLLVLAAPVRPVSATVSGRTAWIAVAAVALLIATVPARAREVLTPLDRDADVTGVYDVAREGSARFVWAGPFSSVFVDGRVRRVSLALRAPSATGPDPLGVEITIAGGHARRFLVSADWTPIALDVPPVAPPMRVQRINIKADRAIDMLVSDNGALVRRPVAVQLGEMRAIEGER